MSTSTPSAFAQTAQRQVAEFLDDIPQSLARGAFDRVSFSPEKRGDRTREGHAADLASDWEFFHAHAVKGGTLDKLPQEFDRYRARIGAALRAYLASSSRCVSSFIVGPANFPAARMNKRADIAHKRMGEYLDARETGRRAVVRNLRPDLRPIMAGDADAADRLAVEIARADARQKMMKAANAAIRKHAKAGPADQIAALVDLGLSESEAERRVNPPAHLACYGQGYPSFKLTNNSANIRRMRSRLEQIERAKATEATQATGADGVRLEDDPPANRVRLFFPGKPADSVRDELKKNGFRWAPSLGAWQAYRREWSLHLARKLAGVTAADAAPVQSAALRAEKETDAEATPQKTIPSARRIADFDGSWRAELTTEPGPLYRLTFENNRGGVEVWDYATRSERAQALRDLRAENTDQPETLPADLDYTAPTETEQLRADFLAAAGKVQNVKSKSGTWAAALFAARPKGAALVFNGPTGELFSSYPTNRERMQALQSLARLADIPATKPDYLALTAYPGNLDQTERAAWFEVATSSQQAAEFWQDALDHENGGRLIDTRNALRDIGWDAEPYKWPISRETASLRVECWSVGAGKNQARVTWHASNGASMVDAWSMTPEALAQALHAMAAPSQPPTPTNSTSDNTEAPETPQPKEQSAAPAITYKRRSVVPDGERIAHPDGRYDCIIYSKNGFSLVVAYLGNAIKPSGHYRFKTENDARAYIGRVIEKANARAEEKARQKAERAAELAKPHCLAVGDVLVSSWGYDQTNIDYYQVTATAGKRTVEVRQIAAETLATGDMTGRCVPVPDKFTSEAKRYKVDAYGGVNVHKASYGRAHKLEFQMVAGVKVYQSHSFSSYA